MVSLSLHQCPFCPLSFHIIYGDLGVGVKILIPKVHIPQVLVGQIHALSFYQFKNTKVITSLSVEGLETGLKTSF